jgi:hypothetical protein
MAKCEKCGKEFDYNYLLERHLNNKKSCEINKNDTHKKYKISKNNIQKNITKFQREIDNINNSINELTRQSLESKTKCKFCNKIFANKNNIERHILNSCNSRKYMLDDINNYNDKINILREEIIELEAKEKTENLEQKIKILENTVKNLVNKNNTSNTTNNINNTTNINNPTINNNLTININSFGKESLDHITDDDYKKYFNSFFKGFLNFIEKIHFDENAPENHNLCLTNIRSKYINVCENNNWVLKEKDEIVEKLINKKYDLLNDKFEEFEGAKKLSDKVSDNFKEFQENYTDVEAQKTTKENVKLMLYNKRDKVKK